MPNSHSTNEKTMEPIVTFIKSQWRGSQKFCCSVIEKYLAHLIEGDKVKMNKRAKSFQRAFQPNVWTEVLSDITQNIKIVKIVGKLFGMKKKLFKPQSKTLSEFNDGLERLTVGFLHIKHQS